MAYYPNIQPGATITADLLNKMMPQVIYKPAHTDRASTTTFTDDPDLIVPLEANGVYYVRMMLHHASTDATRFKTMWRVPSGTLGGNRSCVGPDQGQILSGTSSGGTGRWGVHNFSTASTYGNRNDAGNQAFAMEEGVIFMGSTPGTLALQWAQATSGATNTRLAQGSFMEVRRLA
jgi:hypothetical protein